MIDEHTTELLSTNSQFLYQELGQTVKAILDKKDIIPLPPFFSSISVSVTWQGIESKGLIYSIKAHSCKHIVVILYIC